MVRRSLVTLSLTIVGASLLTACSARDAATKGEATPTADATVATGTLAVSAATLRLNPNAAAPSAAYFTLTGGAADATLVSASSPDVGRIELHESKMEGGMMTMAPLTDVPVPAGSTVEFRQGGKHLMLFDISAAGRAAGKVKLVLAFADGTTLEIEAAAAPVGADPANSAPMPPPPEPGPLVRPDDPRIEERPAVPPVTSGEDNAAHEGH